MICEDILKAENKTIKRIVALDMFGYDKGFVLEFSDGLLLEIEPLLIKSTNEVRLSVKER